MTLVTYNDYTCILLLDQQPASKRSKKGKPQQDKENEVMGKKKQRKALNKEEKSNVMDAVEKMNSTSCACETAGSCT